MKQHGHVAISCAILVLAAAHLIQAAAVAGYPNDHWEPIGALLGFAALVGWYQSVKQAGRS